MHRLAATAARIALLTAALAIGPAGCGGDDAADHHDNAAAQDTSGSETCTWGESDWGACNWGS